MQTGLPPLSQSQEGLEHRRPREPHALDDYFADEDGYEMVVESELPDVVARNEVKLIRQQIAQLSRRLRREGRFVFAASSFPAIQTTIQAMGAHITTIVSLRIVIIQIGSTFLLLGVEPRTLLLACAVPGQAEVLDHYHKVRSFSL